MKVITVYKDKCLTKMDHISIKSEIEILYRIIQLIKVD